MQYQACFKLYPTGKFGLPEGDVLIKKAGPINIPDLLADYVISPAGRRFRVGYSPVSEYRSLSDAIKIKLTNGAIQILIFDNDLILTLNASSLEEAEKNARNIVDNFILNLNLISKSRYYSEFRSLEDPNGRLFNLPIQQDSYPFAPSKFKFVTYDTKAVIEEISSAIDIPPINDKKFEKSYLYYEHALFLQQEAHNIQSDQEQHKIFMLVSSFLHYWKSISTILGESGTDKDYQTRYRQYDITQEYFNKNIEPIRKLRNNEDVAHYKLDSESVHLVIGKIFEARDCANFVLLQYQKHLLNIQNAPEQA